MAQEKRFEELDRLFDNGVTMNALPVGLAAGTAARVFDFDNKLISELLYSFPGKNWRGNVFFASKNPRASRQKPNQRVNVVSTFSHRPNGQIRDDAPGQSSSRAPRTIERSDSQLSRLSDQTLLAGAPCE
jgi:hypothetical protein